MGNKQKGYINTKITGFLKQQIENGATLIFEDPTEHFGNTAISNLLIRSKDISDQAFRTYCLLKSYAYGEKKHCFPGQETLSYWLGKERKYAHRCLKELRELGLVDWVRVGLNSPNVYIIKKIPQHYIDEYITTEREISDKKKRLRKFPIGLINTIATTDELEVPEKVQPLNALDVPQKVQPEKMPEVPQETQPPNTMDVSNEVQPEVNGMVHKEYKKKQSVVVEQLGEEKLGTSSGIPGRATRPSRNPQKGTVPRYVN